MWSGVDLFTSSSANTPRGNSESPVNVNFHVLECERKLEYWSSHRENMAIPYSTLNSEFHFSKCGKHFPPIRSSLSDKIELLKCFLFVGWFAFVILECTEWIVQLLQTTWIWISPKDLCYNSIRHTFRQLIKNNHICISRVPVSTTETALKIYYQFQRLMPTAAIAIFPMSYW